MYVDGMDDALARAFGAVPERLAILLEVELYPSLIIFLILTGPRAGCIGWEMWGRMASVCRSSKSSSSDSSDGHSMIS